MSRSCIPMSSVEQLRRSFAIWTLAIFGSISGTGSVRLDSPLWGAEDPPAGSKADGASKDADTEKKAKTLDRQAIMELVQEKKFDEAIALVDEAVAADPSGPNLYVSYILSSSLNAAKHPDARKRLESVVTQTAEGLTKSPSPQMMSTFMMSRQALASVLRTEHKADEAIKLLKEAIDQSEASPQASPIAASLASQLSLLLIAENLVEEARDLQQKSLDKAVAALKESPTPVNRRTWIAAVNNYVNTLSDKYPDQAREVYVAAESTLSKALDVEVPQLDDYVAYQSLQVAAAMRLAESDATAAKDILDKTSDLADKLSEKLEDADQKRLQGTQATIKSAMSRIQSKLVHQKLLGSPAPEFDTEAVVNMSKVSWADLKGKVVLIDFWAVWCGPCIATFPHLTHLHEQYGDKGLVIVGVTRQYGYVWDKEAGRHVADKEASLEQELEMLEEFRKAHHLEHGFVVTPKSSDFNSKFGVTGIPQAVLVDQEGKIQMIRVGSGEKNSQDLEDKIKQLLGK